MKFHICCVFLTVGHGKSEGDRVHIDTFDTYVNDVIRHVDIVKKKHPGLACYIIGHSMVSCYKLLLTLCV